MLAKALDGWLIDRLTFNFDDPVVKLTDKQMTDYLNK